MPAPESLLPLPPAVFQILIALAGGDRHGYAIIHSRSLREAGGTRLTPGTVYGAIRRMLDAGLVEEAGKEPPVSTSNQRRFYHLTDFGSAVARAETARLSKLVDLARTRGLFDKSDPA